MPKLILELEKQKNSSKTPRERQLAGNYNKAPEGKARADIFGTKPKDHAGSLCRNNAATPFCPTKLAIECLATSECLQRVGRMKDSIV
jgi:hypothetical protein